jgi:hypothetical protein
VTAGPDERQNIVNFSIQALRFGVGLVYNTARCGATAARNPARGAGAKKTS